MLPIILIHRADATFPHSDSSYLQHSVAQAKAWNPASAVYVVGDDSNAHVPLAECRRVADLDGDAKEFAEVYRHLSTNDITYERFCFERWFILAQFLRAEGLAQCLYIDSDVMLYTDVSEQQERFAEFPMTVYQPALTDPAAGFCTYVNDADGLREFCRYLTERYTTPTLLQSAADWFEEYRRLDQNGGICDMSALGDFRRLGRVPVGDLSPITDGTTYDVNLNIPQAFVADRHGKHLEWSAGQPYGVLSEDGRQVRFHALHCQGGAKWRMPSLRTQPEGK